MSPACSTGESLCCSPDLQKLLGTTGRIFGMFAVLQTPEKPEAYCLTKW